jgi:hypothetical protein
MLMTIRRVLAVLLLAGGAAACSGDTDNAPPLATPSVTISNTSPAIGSPVDLAYRFVVAKDAPPLPQGYWVFVHFLDTDGELMWTDDHEPPTPVGQWKPGSTIEYSRTMFIPKFPYVGGTRVEVGLFSPATGERLPLAGQTSGQRSYRVGTFDMRLESNSLLVVFRDGWHETEIAPDGSGGEWQWSTRAATLMFRNPSRGVRLFLQADQPILNAFPEPQHVEIRIGDTVVDRFDLPGGSDVLRKIDIGQSQLGSGDAIEVTVSVDKTFVPALIPTLRSTDPRELGIRVFRAFVEPA